MRITFSRERKTGAYTFPITYSAKIDGQQVATIQATEKYNSGSFFWYGTILGHHVNTAGNYVPLEEAKDQIRTLVKLLHAKPEAMTKEGE